MVLRFSLIVVIVLVLSVGLYAQVEDQAAPNDPRLDQKVTYEADGQVLHKVLSELTDKTGVVMTCGKNKKDWQVRDRKLNIFVKDMSLKDLQQAIGKVLHFTWTSAKKDEVYTYRLFQDLKSKKEEAALKSKAAEEETKKQIEKRQSALAEYEKLDSLTPGEIEKLKSESPFLYMLAKEPLGKAMGQMMREMPEGRSALIEGRELTIDLSTRPPGAAEAAQGFIKSVQGLMQRFTPEFGGHSGIAENIYDAKISFRPPPSEMGDDMSHRGIMGMFEIKVDGQESFEFPMVDPKSPMANLIGKAMIKAEEGASPEEIRSSLASEARQSMSAPAAADVPVDSLPEDPALEKTLKLELTKPSKLGAVLKELAKKSDLQIISDNFIHREQQLPKTEDKLGALLRSVCSIYEKKPKMEGNLVTLEDRRWFEKRSWEVPEDWLEEWHTRIKEGTMDFEDIVDIACLTDPQIMNTIRLDSALGSLTLQLIRNRQILRLYAVLTEPQRRMLFAKEGLDSTQLTDEQWPYFQYALSRNRKEFRLDVPIGIFIDTDEKERTFTIRVEERPIDPETGDQETLRTSMTWKVELPAVPQQVEKKPEPASEPPAPSAEKRQSPGQETPAPDAE